MALGRVHESHHSYFLKIPSYNHIKCKIRFHFRATVPGRVHHMRHDCRWQHHAILWQHMSTVWKGYQSSHMTCKVDRFWKNLKQKINHLQILFLSSWSIIGFLFRAPVPGRVHHMLHDCRWQHHAILWQYLPTVWKGYKSSHLNTEGREWTSTMW